MEWRSERMLVARVSRESAGAVARALRRALASERCDVVATLGEVAIVCEPSMNAVRVALLENAMRAAVENVATIEEVAGRVVVVPVCYDDAFAPDADEVAKTCGIARADIAKLHAGREYVAGFVGFSPGFAYLQGVDERLRLGRRQTPRPRVEAGSVAIAGEQTAVYPSATPGGWHVIGRTPVRVFDATRERPAMIEAGDCVRFEAISREQFDAMVASQSASECKSANDYASDAALRVEHPGSLASVQDAGRRGWMHAGVSASGSADWISRVVANRIVGNDDDAPVIEASLSGPTLLALCEVTLVVCGAQAAMVIEQGTGRLVEVTTMTPITLHAGERLRVRGYSGGARIVIAVGGGVRAASVLGSCSTHVTTRLGGRVLKAGDVIAIGEAVRAGVRASAGARGWLQHAIMRRTLRVTLHSHAAMLGADAVERFAASLWQINTRSDRVGVRLEGASLTHGVSSMASHATLTGDIEVTPDGGLVVLGPDGPVTGGYPVIASVIDADMSALMQARAGEWVRFVVVSLDVARAASREARSTLEAHVPRGEA
ncbi:MAG TPA: 5-oxoprolinase subunit PxpB [Phycisphaerales bacterium]|nr:5-oxoprolinase subunit PxpB [Phycisphaerales bacterium]